MKVSGREAASMLAEAGVARRQARLILDAGLAGRPERTAGALLYDADRVAALVARPSIDRRTVYWRCPHGLLLDRRTDDPARLGKGVGADVELPLTTWVAFELRVVVESGVRLPYVTSVGGFVVSGADIVTMSSTNSGSWRLSTEAPGPWFDDFRDTRWPLGAGPAWQVLGRRVGG